MSKEVDKVNKNCIEGLRVKVRELKWEVEYAQTERKRFSELATVWEKRAYRLEELLKDIDKSLYLGEDLNDKEILDWYICVTKTIKESIKSELIK